jgi:hypothetical protein
MTKHELEKAVNAAFLHAAETLGDRLKGMSCFVKNWRTPLVEASKKAA